MARADVKARATDQPSVGRAEVGEMERAYAGIDVAFAKGKRLPIVVTVRRGSVVEPLPLRELSKRPPVGQGNARALESAVLRSFADDAAGYLREVEASFGVNIERVAIDAPRGPCSSSQKRRLAERGLDGRGISCIATPTTAGFEQVVQRARTHLAGGGAESRIPAANQTWMLAGFDLDPAGLSLVPELFGSHLVRLRSEATRFSSSSLSAMSPRDSRMVFAWTCFPVRCMSWGTQPLVRAGKRRDRGAATADARLLEDPFHGVDQRVRVIQPVVSRRRLLREPEQRRDGERGRVDRVFDRVDHVVGDLDSTGRRRRG